MQILSNNQGIRMTEKKVPKIDPVAGIPNRPFWSIMIPTFNCCEFLEKTLDSVLAQLSDFGTEDVQIEVIDDCSTADNPRNLVESIGKGRIHFYQQPKNVGISRNWLTCIERAKGHWIHILHGDDIVLPGFYLKLQKEIEKNPSIGAAFCRWIYLNEFDLWEGISWLPCPYSGIVENFIDSLAVANSICTPAIVVKREVYEKLGGFHLELSHGADWEMWKRIAAHYPILFEPEVLAGYRQHSKSDTSRLLRTGANVAEMRRAIEISHAYLPESRADYLTTQALIHHAIDGINTAGRFLESGDLEAAIAQLKEGLQCNVSSPEVRRSFINFLATQEASPILDQIIKDICENTANFLTVNQKKVRLEGTSENSYKNNEINLLLVIDWKQEEEAIFDKLYEFFAALIQHPSAGKMLVLIEASKDDQEAADRMLSNVFIQIMMQEPPNENSCPEVCLISDIYADQHLKEELETLSACVCLADEEFLRNSELGSLAQTRNVSRISVEDLLKLKL